MNTFSFYSSTFGKTVIIDRPSLSGVQTDPAGHPQMVTWGAFSYSTLKSISVSEYQRLQPDLVIHRLADGSLLAAPKTLLAGYDPGSSDRWGQSLNPRVEYLTLLPSLPLELP